MSAAYTRDRIAIQDVLLAYAAAVDERDFERYTTCFSPEVEIVGFGTRTYQRRDDWLAYVREALPKYSATQHLLGPTYATIDGDQAQARTDVQALHVLADSGTHFTLWATYHSTLQRAAGRWRIIRHELVVRGTKTD